MTTIANGILKFEPIIKKTSLPGSIPLLESILW